jgi:hypothetical protein
MSSRNDKSQNTHSSKGSLSGAPGSLSGAPGSLSGAPGSLSGAPGHLTGLERRETWGPDSKLPDDSQHEVEHFVTAICGSSRPSST